MYISDSHQSHILIFVVTNFKERVDKEIFILIENLMQEKKWPIYLDYENQNAYYCVWVK